MVDTKFPIATGLDLKQQLDDLSAGANPGPYGVSLAGSGTTWLTLGSWVGHYASGRVPMMGGGRAEIVNSNVPSDWGEISKKPATAIFLKELANAWRDGRIVVNDKEQSE